MPYFSENQENTYFFRKSGKTSQNLCSAAVVNGALRVKLSIFNKLSYNITLMIIMAIKYAKLLLSKRKDILSYFVKTWRKLLQISDMNEESLIKCSLYFRLTSVYCSMLMGC